MKNSNKCEPLNASGSFNVSILYLITIVAPRSKFEEASLLVERKVPNVNFAWGLEDGRRSPEHFAGVVENCFSHCRHHVFSVSTEDKRDLFIIFSNYYQPLLWSMIEQRNWPQLGVLKRGLVVAQHRKRVFWYDSRIHLWEHNGEILKMFSLY